MAGVEQTPDYMQGYDFSAALTGEKSANARQSTYYRYWMHMRHHANPAHFGIRTDQYKLIFFYGQPESTKVKTQKNKSKVAKNKNKKNKANKKPSPEALALLKGTPVGWELYDISADPEETVNLYNNPEYKGVIKKLKQELVQLREDVQENDVDYPHIQQVIEQHWDE